MIILYGKLGRSMPLTLEKCGTLGGDIEMTATLTALAKMRPDDTIVLIGRNTGENPQDVDLPANIVNPWTELNGVVRQFLNEHGMNHPNLSIEEHQVAGQFMLDITAKWWDTADEVVMWVGQHGTTNHPIPKVGDRSVLTKPHDAFTYYVGYLLQGINRWRDGNSWKREPIFLNADPRNYLKMRDMKWPLRHPILTQYAFEHNIKNERYGDGNDPHGFILQHANLAKNCERDEVWSSRVANVYSRLELNALMPGTPSGDLLKFDSVWEGRERFGIVINEARSIGIPYEKSRLHAMRNWVMQLRPSFVFGTWSKESEATLLAENPWYIPQGPLPWNRYASAMHQVRCTFTTPSSGSGWATTKPWEAFGLGVVCFFHPDYDTQNNILGDADPMLRNWLRVRTPQDLRDRVFHLSTPAGRSDWEELVRLQKQHFDNNMRNPTFLRMINDRLEHRS